MTRYIAFLGTGIMGCPIACNLRKAGFTAAVWNRTKSKTEPLKTIGARTTGYG
jgi:3-hydroxyisobutyrate dehydrogenase-like beta-hydroxyacid dehydrogenase